ncbi:MAG: arginase family protein [Thermomicrobiales bacterium]
MASLAERGLNVIGVRYRGSTPSDGDERSVDFYRRSGAYGEFEDRATFTDPEFPENRRQESPTANLGIIGGEIADAVANGIREGRGTVMVGGDCAHITGVLGGWQDVHGPTARIGLVWFDAHGDFNTSRTSLSGMLGGMPVAVAAGLDFPEWREASHLPAPIPTDRILMVDVRNLDPAEEQLVRATSIRIAAPAQGFPGDDLEEAVADLASRCDYLYLHIDSDILDARFVPNHGTQEPDGPNIEQVIQAIDTVMATGKVVALALVSVSGEGDGAETTRESAAALLKAGIESWERHGLPEWTSR